MIGYYGAGDLVAVAGATTVFDIVANIVLASVIGHQILSARFAGSHEPGGIRDSARATAMFGGGLALICVLLCVLLGGMLVGLVIGDQPQLEQIGGGFLRACSPTLLLLVPFNLFTATINAYKRPRFTMIASILVNVVNLGLDRLLIYGAGPIPRLGAVGSGLATTASWAIGLVFVGVVAWRLRLIETVWRAVPVSKVDFETSIPRLVWPAITSMGVDYVSAAVFFAIIGRVGATALGGGRIAFEVMGVAFGILGAFGSGSRVLVGRAVGARDFPEAYGLWRAGQRILAVFALPVAALLVGMPNAIGSLFTSFPQLQHEAGVAIRVVGISLPLMALTLGSVSALRALGKTRWDMYGNLLASTCVQVPLSWMCADILHLGLVGAFVGIVGYWFSRGVASEVLARRAMRNASPSLRVEAIGHPAATTMSELKKETEDVKAP
jgi:putative MATE family efflux protein